MRWLLKQPELGKTNLRERLAVNPHLCPCRTSAMFSKPKDSKAKALVIPHRQCSCASCRPSSQATSLSPVQRFQSFIMLHQSVLQYRTDFTGGSKALFITSSQQVSKFQQRSLGSLRPRAKALKGSDASRPARPQSAQASAARNWPLGTADLC